MSIRQAYLNAFKYQLCFVGFRGTKCLGTKVFALSLQSGNLQWHLQRKNTRRKSKLTYTPRVCSCDITYVCDIMQKCSMDIPKCGGNKCRGQTPITRKAGNCCFANSCFVENLFKRHMAGFSLSKLITITGHSRVILCRSNL